MVIQLRELKSSQLTKKKQLESLEVRERSVLRRITHGGGEEDNGGEAGQEMSFGLPLSMEGGRMTEEQRLIQTGQLTPFGGHIDDADIPSADSALSRLNDAPVDGEVCAATSSAAANKTSHPSIQLSNDSFGGLFSDAVFVKPAKRQTPPTKQKEKKSDRACEEDKGAAVCSAEMSAQPSSLTEVVEENGESEWKLSEAELAMFESDMLSSSESEEDYVTDDEMGSPTKKKKKRKKLRELSSDEDDVEGHVTSKKRGRKWKTKGKHYLDDGDDDLFRLRLRYVVKPGSYVTKILLLSQY